MQDSFIFYRSFFEGSEMLSDEEFGKLCRAICEYALNHKEIELDGFSKSIFTFIKPGLDSSQKRYIASITNGKKGGRPKSKNEPKHNLEKTQPKPKHNLDNNLIKTKTKPLDTNINNNSNINSNIVIDYFNNVFNKNLYQKGSTYKQIESYVKLIIKAGDTVDDIKLVIDYKKANPNTKKQMLEAWINTKYFANNLNAAQAWHYNGRLPIAEFSLNSSQNPMSALIQENINLINSGAFVPPLDYVESEE